MEDQDNRRLIPVQPPPIHPFVPPLSYLLGTWRGQGEGGYPTISPFLYGEEIHFTHSAGDILRAEDMELGIRKDNTPRINVGTMDIVIGQSTSIAEVQSQKWIYNVNEQKISLQSDPVGNAAKVKEISREFEMIDDKLSSVVHMTTIANHLQLLVKSLLHKL